MSTALRMPAGNNFVRTFLQLQEWTGNDPVRMSGKITPVVVCNNMNCNKHLTVPEPKILVLEDFRCQQCFLRLVRAYHAAFEVPESATDDDIMSLLEPGRDPRVPNLMRLPGGPRFLPI